MGAAMRRGECCYRVLDVPTAEYAQLSPQAVKYVNIACGNWSRVTTRDMHMGMTHALTTSPAAVLFAMRVRLERHVDRLLHR